MTALETLRDRDLPVDFGRYTLVGLLGVGGMGRVFRAELRGPSGFRKTLALKVIGKPVGEESQRNQEEFFREARVSGLLKHPNIVDVYDFGIEEGRPWLAMELVEGQTLAQLLFDGPLPPTAALDLGLQVCAALSHAHALKADGETIELVHRDLKPANILITPRGLVKVVDFGLARAAGGATDLTQSGTIRGTPAYMAPEQARDEPLDARTDLFALGLLLYELVTGERLLQRDSLVAVMMALVQIEAELGEPERVAGLDAAVPGLGAVVRKLCRHDPQERYTRASEVATELRALAARLGPGPSLQSHLSGEPESPSFGSVLRPPTDDAATRILPTAGTSSTRGSQRVARRTNLAPDGGAFVGRAEALADLGRGFDEGSKLVTLLGPGGTGKTRLARRYGASKLQDLLPHGGAWFCDLSEARSVDGVLHVVALTLGIPLDRAAEGTATFVGEALADRGPMLVILDNVEQVVASVVELAGCWLELCPDLQLLVTSRERLRLPDELVLDLGPLQEDDAVALFEERAKAQGRGFVLKESDRPIVAEIVRRLDCLPLAVELAAARTSVLAPRKILDRLDHRFRLLAHGSRAAGRQATLRGAIQWSWDLLDDTERLAFAQCAVFRGGFTLEMAEEVIDVGEGPDAPWALDLVQTLRDKSLLRSWEPPGLHGEVRFGMYESLRAFAAEQLEALGIVDEANARHAAALVTLGLDLARRIELADGRLARRQLALELDNLQAAYERRAARAPSEAMSAVLAMSDLLAAVGPVDLYRRVLNEALALPARGAEAKTVRLQLLIRRVSFVRGHGDFERATADAAEAEAIAESLGDELSLVQTLRAQVFNLIENGRLEESLPIAERALAVARALENDEALGAALNAVGYAWGFNGRDEESFAAHLEALEAWRRVGNRRREADEVSNIAVYHGNRGNIEEAEPRFQQALELHRELGTRRGEGLCLGNLSLVALQRGRLGEAKRRAVKSAEIQRAIGERAPRGMILCNLGCVLLLEGQTSESVRVLEEAVEILRGLGRRFYLAIAWRDLAVAYLAAGRGDDAVEAARQGVESARGMPKANLVAINLATLGAALASAGSLAEADTFLHEAQAAAELRGDESERAYCATASCFHLLATLPLLDEASSAAVLDQVTRAYEQFGFADEDWTEGRPVDSTLRALRWVLGDHLDEL